MRLMRWFGVGVLLLGVLLIADFFSTNVNPNVAAANFGLLALVLGGLILGADAFRRRASVVFQTPTMGRPPMLVTFGWSILSLGLLIGLNGFLLENQVMCSCPATGSCECGVLLYGVMFMGGLVAAVAGAVIVAAGTIVWKRKQRLTIPPLCQLKEER